MENTNKVKRTGILAFVAALSLANAVFAFEEGVENLGETGLQGKNSTQRTAINRQSGAGATTIGVAGNGTVFDGSRNPLLGKTPNSINSPVGGATRVLPGTMSNIGGLGSGVGSTTSDQGAVVPAVGIKGSGTTQAGGAIAIDATTTESVLSSPQDVTAEDAKLMPTGINGKPTKSVFE